MQLIIDEIRDLTHALSGLRSDSIVMDNLNEILSRLKASDVDKQMAGYALSLPSAPEEKQALEKHKDALRDQADLLNKEADRFLDELNRIKTIRQTLNLEALDPIISESRRIIHSIHGFSAGLQED
jgi:hypothetical protein